MFISTRLIVSVLSAMSEPIEVDPVQPQEPAAEAAPAALERSDAPKADENTPAGDAAAEGGQAGAQSEINGKKDVSLSLPALSP